MLKSAGRCNRVLYHDLKVKDDAASGRAEVENCGFRRWKKNEQEEGRTGGGMTCYDKVRKS